jgi:hypothetical protein
MDMGFLNNTEADNRELMRMALNAGNDEQTLNRFRQQIQNQKMDRLSADGDNLRNFRQQRQQRQQRQMEDDEETLRRFRQQRQMEGLMRAAQRETPRQPETLEIPPTPPLSPRAYVRINTPDENARLLRMAERDASLSDYVRSNTRAENDALMDAFPQRNMPQMSLDLMERARQDATDREDARERRRRLAQELQAEAEYGQFLADSQAAAGMGLSSGELTSGQQMSRDLYSSMRPGMGRL